MWWCCFTISHSGTMGEIVPWREGFHSGQPSFRTTPCWQPHNWAPCFFAGCRTSMDCKGVTVAAEVGVCHKTVLHILHDILGYRKIAAHWVPHTLSEVQQWQVNNSIGLVEPVPEGRWWLRWKDRHSVRNLDSLVRTTFEATIKWMEASWLLIQRQCALHRVMWRRCSLWHMTWMEWYCTTLSLKDRQ